MISKLAGIAVLVVLLDTGASGQIRQSCDRQPIESPRGTTITVDWRGSGDTTTIQDALDMAASGDTIVVLSSDGSPAGAYVENLAFPAMQVTLRSVDPLDPAVVAATVIDGGLVGRVVTFAFGAPPEAVLDGFTIQNGQAFYGGGIYCESGQPTISHCTITNNEADLDGGGIYCNWGGSPTVTDCTISLNQASDYGGGICCYSGSDLTLRDSTVADNQGLAGSGIASFSSHPVLTNCVVTGNTSAGGT